MLDRLDGAWVPWTAPHQFILGMTGAGKTTLARLILGRCCYADRVVVLDPKPGDDPSWTAGEDVPVPVTSLAPGSASRARAAARRGGGSG
jgi:hypothetical protein